MSALEEGKKGGGKKKGITEGERKTVGIGGWKCALVKVAMHCMTDCTAIVNNFICEITVVQKTM